MKRYMIVYIIDGEQGAHFCDEYTDAYNFSMDVDVAMGGYAEIYERIQDGDGIMIYSPI